MDLQINNEIDKTVTNEKNNEVNTFIEELNNSLKKENQFSTVIANEIYNENPLAIKYKDQLEDIIEECFENMSYEKDFFYFDYDSKDKTYYLNYYSEGKKEKVEITKQELEETKLEEGWFYAWYDKEQIVEASSLKDRIMTDVESELEILEMEKNRNK